MSQYRGVTHTASPSDSMEKKAFSNDQKHQLVDAYDQEEYPIIR